MIKSNEREKRKFKCDLTNSNLFNCILNDLEEEDLKNISEDPSRFQSETILNCLGAGIITCLGNRLKNWDIERLDPQVEFSAERNDQGFWRFKSIEIRVNETETDNLVVNTINQCLKFIKKSCQISDHVDLSLMKVEVIKDLKDFKLKILEMKDWLKDIKTDKVKSENLFDSLKKIAK